MSKPDKNTYSKHTIYISMFLCGKMLFMMWQNVVYKNVPRLYLCMFHGGLNIY